MNALTSKRVNGIKTGYWSPAKKEELVQRLGAYEATGLEPEEILVMQWISPEYELPPNDDLVLCIVNGKPTENVTLCDAYLIGGYDADFCEWYFDEYPEWVKADVAYWMPLPEPPKEVEA